MSGETSTRVAATGWWPRRRPFGQVAAAAAIGCAVAGCVPPPAVTPEPSPAPPAAAPAVASPAHRVPSGFEAHHRARALALETQGRWGEAAAHWDALALAEPGAGEPERRAREARARGAAAAAAHLRQATAARARGDLAAATREFLAVLVADPANAAAADALRAIEAERTRRALQRKGGAVPGDRAPAPYHPPKPGENDS